jgi:membrane protease YdiL (CAAX protease family)
MKKLELTSFAPFLMVFARPILAILAQGLLIVLFVALKQPSYNVTAWWTVYGTLIDIVCLILLVNLLKREGKSLFDLLSFNKGKIFSDVLIGLGIFIFVFPLAMAIGSILSSLMVYGSLEPNLPEGAYARELPLWAVLYSRIIWWVLWSFTEELTYQGYALPRIQVITGRKWVAVLIVGFGWALQHSFLPYITVSHSVWMFIMFFPLAVAMQLLYLKIKRLFPLIVAHWAMDLISVIFMVSHK